MEYRYANLAVFVDVGMPHGGEEGHGGWHVGEIGREDEAGFEEASFVECAVGAHDEDFPIVNVGVVGEAYGDEVDGVLGQLCVMLCV